MLVAYGITDAIWSQQFYLMVIHHFRESVATSQTVDGSDCHGPIKEHNDVKVLSLLTEPNANRHECTGCAQSLRVN